MNDLIEALQIFSKYMDTQWPTTCEHDFLYVCVDAELISPEDEARLEVLGFHPDENGGYCSSRFGSC